MSYPAVIRRLRVLFAVVTLVVLASPTRAQSLAKWLFVSSADFVKNDRGALWVSAAQPLAGRVTGAVSGWIGFYPIAQAITPVSVTRDERSPHIWPQPARTWVHIRTERDALHFVDLFGRSVSVAIERVSANVVRADVSALTSGVYAIEGVGMLRVW